MQSKVAKIQRQIDALEKQKSALTSKEKVQVIKDINYKIGLYEINSDELSFSTSNQFRQPHKGTIKVAKHKSTHPLAGIPVKPKYALGDKTWSGRGRQPLWVLAYLNDGGRLEDLAIDKPATPAPAVVIPAAKPVKPKSKARVTAETMFNPEPPPSSTSEEPTQHSQ